MLLMAQRRTNKRKNGIVVRRNFILKARKMLGSKDSSVQVIRCPAKVYGSPGTRNSRGDRAVWKHGRRGAEGALSPALTRVTPGPSHPPPYSPSLPSILHAEGVVLTVVSSCHSITQIPLKRSRLEGKSPHRPTEFSGGLTGETWDSQLNENSA